MVESFDDVGSEQGTGDAPKHALDIENLAIICHDVAPGTNYREWHAIAEKIMDVIKEECQLHKKILVPRLYAKIRRRVDIEPQFALRIVEYLEKHHFIKDNSPLLKSTVLENEKRKHIYSEICHFPGIYFNLLKSKTDSGSKIIDHHITILLEFGFIFEEMMNGKRCFFPVSTAREHSWFSFFFQLEPTRKIIDVYLHSSVASMTPQELSKHTGMNYALIVYHVNKLVSKNVLVVEDSDGRHVYALSHEFQAFMKRVLKMVS
jgi:hypothetical protein